MALTVVAENSWIERRVVINPDPLVDRAMMLMAACHERHVPLTPVLARQLAQLETSGELAIDPDWGRAFQRAGEAMGVPSLIGHSAFWLGSLSVFVSIVVEPVLRNAAGRVPEIYLKGEADFPTQGNGKHDDLSLSWIAIEAAVSKALDDTTVMGRGFWVVAGVALHAAATQALERKAGLGENVIGHGLPGEPDIPLSRMLFEVEPWFDDNVTRRRQRKSRAISVRKRAGIRPKEGGVAGIRTSRMVEDLPDSLLSELIHPEEIVASKIAQEGLMVRHRPPLREPKRDLLSLMLADGRVGDTGFKVVKAAWADASLRLRFMLASRGMERSELLWSQETPSSQSHHMLSAEIVRLPAGIDPMDLNGPLRSELILRSGLMPTFLDPLPRKPALHVSDPAFLMHLPVLATPALATLAHKPVVGKSRRDRRADPTRPADYHRRLAIICVPGDTTRPDKAADQWAGFRAQVRSNLKRTCGTIDAVAMLIVPGRMDANLPVVGLTEQRGQELTEISLSDDESGADGLARLIGLLSSWIIDVTLGAVDAG